jgi:hypothetical protein
MTPWLSVIIPTIGRPTLPRLLDSMDRQERHGEGVQILVVGDSHAGADLRQARDHVLEERDADRYVWLEHDGGVHAWGHPQRTVGMQHAAAPWIAFSQDDNIMTWGAFASIHDAIDKTPEPHPILLRVRTWQAGVVWRVDQVSHGNVDADCVVVPNDPQRFGRWEHVYEGDFHFIRQTVNRWGGHVTWSTDVIALGRPTDAEDWTRGR